MLVGPCRMCHMFGYLRTNSRRCLEQLQGTRTIPFICSVKDAFISMGSSAELVKEYQSVGANDDKEVNGSMGDDDDGLSYRYWE